MDLFRWHDVAEAVAAQQNVVADLDDARVDVGDALGAAVSEAARDTAPVGVNRGLLFGDHALGHELLDHGVVQRDRGRGAFVDEVGAAVAGVRDPHLVADAHDHHRRAAHALGVGVALGVVGDGGAGEQEAVVQELARSLFAEVVRDVF